ncbi:MAG: ferredoxin, partial [Puniceicoccaceae bacterium]
KSGTFINQNFRLQQFLQAIPAPLGLISDAAVLRQILLAMGEGEADEPFSIEAIWKSLSETIPSFKGIEWSSIPEEGIALEAGAFKDLPFVETENLKYKPRSVEAVAQT